MRKPISAEVILEGETRVVVTIFDDGEIVRTLVNPNREPTRKPRRPMARVRVKLHEEKADLTALHGVVT